MVGMSIIGKAEISRRKTISDRKNDTDNLTFDGANSNARAAAYKSSRDLKDRLEIRKIATTTDEEEMLKELDELEKE